ncbi:hypothetical protein FQA39_LY12856 [Lamprigera yunnana]|nr:hypothetical protein FQA39_LY12856 [Lamprigera yunnana]
MDEILKNGHKAIVKSEDKDASSSDSKDANKDVAKSLTAKEKNAADKAFEEAMRKEIFGKESVKPAPKKVEEKPEVKKEAVAPVAKKVEEKPEVKKEAVAPVAKKTVTVKQVKVVAKPVEKKAEVNQLKRKLKQNQLLKSKKAVVAPVVKKEVERQPQTPQQKQVKEAIEKAMVDQKKPVVKKPKKVYPKVTKKEILESLYETLIDRKCYEVRDFIVAFPEYDVKTTFDIPGFEDIEEDGLTFEENAMIKAKALALYIYGVAIGDDTGIEVEALNDFPGIYSKR